jgi:hypothetical protein
MLRKLVICLICAVAVGAGTVGVSLVAGQPAVAGCGPRGC